MEYKINELAKLASITTRTLRYYDQIGLLKPSIVKPSGYRFYGHSEVDRLEQIMYLKSLDFPLKSIKKMLENTELNHVELLKNHLTNLNKKSDQLDLIIKVLKHNIETKEKNIKLSDQDKFKGFKNESLDINEKLYKVEIENTWGKEFYQQSKKAIASMSEQDYKRFKELETNILIELKKAFDNNLSLNSSEIISIAQEHQKWITLAWGRYDVDAHFQLVDLYVEDDRFKAYYDKEQEGLAELLRNAVQSYLAK